MPDQGIPQEVLDFLRQHVLSFEQLEVLGYLLDANGSDCALADVAAALRLAEPATEDALEHLVWQELAAGAGKKVYRWAPRTHALAAAATATVRAGRADRLAMMQIMIANAIERLRSGAARTFADSFLLRRPKSDG